MKRYRMERKPDEGVVAKVVDDDWETPLRHMVAHSPTGFETGFGGSGPADLALSILADYFGESERDLREGLGPTHEPSLSWTLYQSFKWRFIAPRPLDEGESYTITSADIEAWLTAVVFHNP